MWPRDLIPAALQLYNTTCVPPPAKLSCFQFSKVGVAWDVMVNVMDAFGKLDLHAQLYGLDTFSFQCCFGRCLMASCFGRFVFQDLFWRPRSDSLTQTLTFVFQDLLWRAVLEGLYPKISYAEPDQKTFSSRL